MVRTLQQMKRTETKTIDGHYTEGKPTCTEVLQASMFDTDHQETTFCVFTQHNTVG
jgi:hypothetical protein